MADSNSTAIYRICTKCSVEKPIEEFSKAKGGKYGRTARCRACASAYMHANQDRINELSLARYHRLQEQKRITKRQARANRLASEVKTCGKCKVEKKKTEFGAAKGRVDGLKVYCKLCHNSVNKEVRDANPEAAKEWADRWKASNPDIYRERIRRHQRKPSYRVHHAISARLYASLKTGKYGNRTTRIVGYSIGELMRHLEKQFAHGMSWDNYGEWHIDHILPLSSFGVLSFDDPLVKQAWGLPNLRPLWAIDNMKKNAKILFLI